jgi:dihydroorotate dehydrogenase (fumarate)
MLSELESWMKSRSYNSIKDFQGKLSKHPTTDPFTYSRAQYVDIIMKADEILKKYPMG